MRKPLQEPVDLHGLVSSAAAAGVLGLLGLGAAAAARGGWLASQAAGGPALAPCTTHMPCKLWDGTTSLLGLAALQDNGD